MALEAKLVPIPDEWEPSKEDIEDYWGGEGHLEFRVLSYDKTATYLPYEIECLDCSGCVGGLDETLGIEYAVNNGILDVGPLQIGMTYHVQGITVVHTRGDGWTTDDDSKYYVESVTKILIPSRFIAAWWWDLIGWRLRNACAKARTTFRENR